MSKMSKRISTQHFEQFIPNDVAWCLYYTLRDTLGWTDGIKNTRKASPYKIGTHPELDSIIFQSINKCFYGEGEATILGVYINYYRDGNDHAPSHSHYKQKQCIISLGATRTLIVGSKELQMKNGDIASFGSGSHSVPKDPQCTEGRISIAIFLNNSLLESTNIFESDFKSKV